MRIIISFKELSEYDVLSEALEMLKIKQPKDGGESLKESAELVSLTEIQARRLGLIL